MSDERTYPLAMGVEQERRAMRHAELLLEASHYTTVALRLLAKWHAEHDDDVGARLLESFASQFAEHEAETL